MVVKVLSQQAFNYSLEKRGINDLSVANLSKTIFISITDTSGMDAHFKYNHPNVLNLKFDDLTDEEWERIAPSKQKELTLFNEEHAKKIIEFLNKNQDKEYAMVHCAAGVSRSGAVGTFINDFYSKVDHFTFMGENRYIKPNAYISSILKRVYYECYCSS